MLRSISSWRQSALTYSSHLTEPPCTRHACRHDDDANGSTNLLVSICTWASWLCWPHCLCICSMYTAKQMPSRNWKSWSASMAVPLPDRALMSGRCFDSVVRVDHGWAFQSVKVDWLSAWQPSWTCTVSTCCHAPHCLLGVLARPLPNRPLSAFLILKSRSSTD